MKIISTDIPDLLVLEPHVFTDQRGYFFESYNTHKLPEEISSLSWVQDNESKSKRGVLRGLHYQTGEAAQSKLVRAVIGVIYDVAVDLRVGSSTFGKWVGVELSGENKRQLFIPKGFAHGFVVLSEDAIFSYKCDNFYLKNSEGGILYNDLTLNINWQIKEEEILVSEKDGILPIFGDHRPIES